MSASAATRTEWESVVALSNDGGVVGGAMYFSRSNASSYNAMMFPCRNCRIRVWTMRL